MNLADTVTCLGRDVLIMFDGARDKPEIYTVVIDFGLATSARVDSADLEKILLQLYGTHSSGTGRPAEDYADPLCSFDLLAKRGFVVGPIILRDGEHVDLEVFLLRDDTTFKPMRRRGPVFADVAGEIVRYAGLTA